MARQQGSDTVTPGLDRRARDAALGTGMKEGMDQSFARLNEVLRALA